MPASRPYTPPPPRFVFMEINKRCNLRCTQCDFWKRDDDDRDQYMQAEQKLAVLDEFAGMNLNGHLVICGGEPMLDATDFFDLASGARERGVRVLSIVNGTRIRRAEMARRMIAEGPNEISISLNSHVPEIHDATRGVPGAFDKAVRALRLLVEAKRELGAEDTRIYVLGLVFASNYKLIEGFYDFVLNDIGADQLKLNFLQPTFGHSGEVDPFFAAESGIDGEELVQIIQRCDAKYSLGLNPIWIEQVRMYFQSLQGMDDLSRGWHSRTQTHQHICNTYERNVMINHYGVARLCFNGNFRGEPLREPGDFTRFWNNANDIRTKMRQCNDFCGISHCVRRESSTLKGRDKMLAHQDAYGLHRPPSMAAELLEVFRSMARA